MLSTETLNMLQSRILVVDDDADSLYIMELLFNRLGFAVTTASNGREALGRVSSYPIDLLLTDLSMPVMDGVELCRRLKASPSSRHIPIIVTSALPQLPPALEGVVSAYLRKPIDFERLREALAAHLPRR
jgi:CheY-like chemotaxis protein